MTSRIALSSIAKGDNWLTAIALSAGYSYDETLYSQAIVGPSSTVIPRTSMRGLELALHMWTAFDSIVDFSFQQRIHALVFMLYSEFFPLLVPLN